ncbi:MAG: hypothetical protein SFY67_00520 [Candidatus Melainabacteria bacterium]|nr:hypothetical protein [Candidatus Melainabacteria bacterium]
MNTNPEKKYVDPVDLEGLEDLLDAAHVKVMTRTQETELSEDSAVTYFENRSVLELLARVQEVHSLLTETNNRLLSAYERMRQMERLVDHQEKRLELLPALEKQAVRATELQVLLDEALVELERLRQPWWQQISSRRKPR